MPEIKIGDEVFVRCKVEEIRETKDGKRYKVRVAQSHELSFDTLIISSKDIIDLLERR